MTAGRSGRIGLCAILLVVVAACGGPGGAPGPTADATASSGTPGISPAPASAADPTPSIGTPGTSPAAGAEIDFDLPTDWRDYSSEAYRLEGERYLEQLPAAEQALIRIILDEIDAGAMRRAAVGPAGFESWSGSLTLFVYDDATLEAAIARLDRRTRAATVVTSEVRTSVDLPIGPGVRTHRTFAVPDGVGEGAVPSQTVEYLVELPDGRIAWLSGTGPEAAGQAFGDLIDAVAKSLRLVD